MRLATLTPEKIFAQDELREQSESSQFIIPTFRYGAEYRSRVYFSPEGEPLITLSVPIIVPITRHNIEEISTIDPAALQRGEGEILGVLAVEASIKDILLRSTGSFDMGKEGYIYLVDGEGELIAHSNQEFVGNMDMSQADVMKLHIAQDKQIFQKTGGHPFEQIITSQGTSEIGKEVLATLYEIPRLRWGLVVEQSISEAFATLHRVERFALLLFFGGIAMTIAFSFWFAYLLTKSIEILHKGVRMIKLGNLGYRVQLHTNDEVQDLAEAFNGMIEGIENARKRDQAISRMKSEFLSIAAHQLRTPLSAMKWGLNMLLSGDFGALLPIQKKWIEKEAESNKRMITLVNDLLNVVKIEEGGFSYLFKSESFADLIVSVVKDIQVLAEKKDTKIVLDMPKEKFPPISMDIGNMRLALANIFDNAISYTMPGGTITTRLLTQNDSLLVKISDTGIGISEDEKKRVFTKFFRGVRAIRLETEGSGLGLFITQNIIRKHGGKIWIESEEGKGTAVYFSLPFKNKR